MFLMVADPIRMGEARLAAAISQLAGVGRIGLAANAAVLVVPDRGPAFFGIVTRSCSATASLLCLGVLSVLVIPHRRRNRWRAVGAGAATVFVLNEIRLVAILWIGSRLGPERITPVHDLLGTPMSLFGAAFGVVVWWMVLERGDRSVTANREVGANPSEQ
jgi:exosortase/archaeosortase family protein